MKTTNNLPLALAAGLLLVSAFAARTAASAAEVTVYRGNDTIAVNTSAPQRGPHVLRGGMGPKKPKEKRISVRQTVNVSPSVVGAGGTVWFRTDRGLVACSLRGTGYVGERRIRCFGQ